MACYSLLNCDGVTTATINYAPGGLTIGNVITTDPALPGPSNCWEVAENIAPCGGTEVTITSIFDHGANPLGCIACEGIVPIKLKNCDESGGIVYIQIKYTAVQTVGTVWSLDPMPSDYLTLPNCWEVVAGGELTPFNYDVTIMTDQTDCETCTANPPCYILKSCTSGNSTFYYTTSPAFSIYANLGLTTQIVEHPGCFTVELVSGACDCISATALTPTGDPNCTCTTSYNCYSLTDCNNPSFIIYSDNNLNPYVGLTVSVAEYPGFCFNVAGIANPFICNSVLQETVSCVEICICGAPIFCYTLTN